MPLLLVWLGSTLTSLLAGLATAFVSIFTKRVAVTLAAVGILVALTAGFFAGIDALITGIGAALPSYITTSIGLFLPGNLTLCTSIVISAYVARYAYDWNVRIVLAKIG